MFFWWAGSSFRCLTSDEEFVIGIAVTSCSWGELFGEIGFCKRAYERMQCREGWCGNVFMFDIDVDLFTCRIYVESIYFAQKQVLVFFQNGLFFSETLLGLLYPCSLAVDSLLYLAIRTKKWCADQNTTIWFYGHTYWFYWLFGYGYFIHSRCIQKHPPK